MDTPEKEKKPLFKRLFERFKKAPPEAEAPPPGPTEEELLAAKQRDQKAEDERRRQLEETLTETKDSRLYMLQCRLRGIPPDLTPGAMFSTTTLMEDGAIPNSEQKAWLAGIAREVRTMPQYAGLRSAAGDAPDEAGENHDALVLARVAADNMSAWVFVLPPLFDGASPTPEQMENKLDEAGVRYGVDAQALQTACEPANVLRLIRVANGTPAQNGADGQVVDHFRRDSEIRLVIKDDGTIDYKDLGWLQTAEPEDVVCDIVLPTPGVPGRTVRDAELRPKPGQKPAIPKGQGTALNADGTLLSASAGGVVTFDGSAFRVDPLLIIQGDVDMAVGYVDTVGDVLIHGDVLEGFTVRATGNVTVQGMAEGATLTAGGNIRVGRGMNGNLQGTMEAGGDILSRFIENATATAGGSVICDSIVNSTILSNNDVQVKTGRGTIVGGSIAARQYVQARTIGNRAHRATKITLGNDVAYLREKTALETERSEVASELGAIEKNLQFLKKPGGKLPTGGKSPEELTTGRMVLRRRQASIDRQIEELRSAHKPAAGCRILAEVIYPPLEVEIFGVTDTIRETLFNAEVRLFGKTIEAETRWEDKPT